MLKELKPAILIFAVMTLLTGVLYPTFITVIGQTFFNKEANGSLVKVDGKPVGSRLIGQAFDDPKYFWSRLSATAPAYNAAASSGSNYGPMNPALTAAVLARVEALKTADPSNTSPVPADLATASGSGLDPHISPAAAYYQAARIARVRGMALEQVRDLIKGQTEGRFVGLAGEPVVNVLMLNLALDHGGKYSEIDLGLSKWIDYLPDFMKWTNLEQN